MGRNITFMTWVGVLPLGHGYAQHLYDMDMSITFRIWIGVLPLVYRHMYHL